MTTRASLDVHDAFHIEGGTGFPSGVRVGPAAAFVSVESPGGESTAMLLGHIPGERLAAVASELVASTPLQPPRYGRFAAIVYRRAAAEVQLLTDRYGSVPMYAAERNGTLWVSPSLDWLLNASDRPGTLDLEALGELLTFKFVLGVRTLFDGVERLPAAAITTIHLATRQRSSETYWRPVPSGRRYRLAERAGALTEAFNVAVGRLMAGTTCAGVTLSGGLDSRAILASAIAHEAKVWALTTGIPGGLDQRYSAEVVRAAKVEQVLALLDAPYRAKYFDLTAASIRSYEGMLLTSGSEVLWLAQSCERTGIEIVLHGALGELAKSATANHFAVGRSEVHACESDVAGFLSRPYESAHRGILSVLAPHLRGQLGGLALNALKARIDRLREGMSQLDVAAAMQVLEHFRNSAVYSAKLWEPGRRVHYPFADPDYVDLLLDVDPSDRIDPDFHTTLLRALQPSLARLPESNSTCAPDSPRWVKQAASLRLKVLQRLRPGRAAGHTDFCRWINDMPVRIDDFLLGDEARAREYWDTEAVSACIERTRSGSQSAAELLQRLMCVELIRRTW